MSASCESAAAVIQGRDLKNHLLLILLMLATTEIKKVNINWLANLALLLSY